MTITAERLKNTLTEVENGLLKAKSQRGEMQYDFNYGDEPPGRQTDAQVVKPERVNGWATRT